MSRPRRTSERLLTAAGAIVTALVVAFVLAPAVMTIVLSLSNDPTIAFPPKTWGVDRYVALVSDGTWLRPLWLSVQLAMVSAVVAVVIGMATLLAIHRSQLPFRGWLEQASLTSMVIPVSAYAVAMYAVFSQYRLLGTFVGLAIAHAVLALPLVILIGGAALRSMSQDLELVAYTLGANRPRAWFGITGRMMLPALGASFALAFQTSFEEAVFVNFLGGPGLVTLPKAIFDSVQFGSDPVITAIATIIIGFSTVAVAIPLALFRGNRS